MKLFVRVIKCLLFMLAWTVPAFAEEAAVLVADTGDTAWVLTSAALVLLMTPGLVFFTEALSARKTSCRS